MDRDRFIGKLSATRDADRLERQLARERARREEAEKMAMRLQEELRSERLHRQRLEMELSVRQASLLSLWDPRDYVRLLWWILLQPERLKEYRTYLDARAEEDLARQGSWLASSLLWLSLGLWIGWPLYSGGAPAAAGTFAILLTAVAFGWILTGMLGWHDNPLSALACVFTAAVATLVVTAITSGLVFGELASPSVLPLGLVAMISIMAAMTVGSIIGNAVTDVTAGVFAVVVGTGVVLLVTRQPEQLVGSVVVIVAAIVFAGFIQERYKEA